MRTFVLLKGFFEKFKEPWSLTNA